MEHAGAGAGAGAAPLQEQEQEQGFLIFLSEIQIHHCTALQSSQPSTRTTTGTGIISHRHLQTSLAVLRAAIEEASSSCFSVLKRRKLMSSIPLMAREEQLRYGAGGKALRSGRRRGGVYDRPLSGRHAPPELRAAADPRRQSRLSKIVDPPAPILKDSASSCFLSSPFRKSLPAIGPAPAPEDDSDASQKSHGQIDAGDYGSVTEDVRSGILRSEQICRQMLEIYFKLQNSNTKTPPINPSAPSDKFSCKKVLFQSLDNPWADDKETTNVANVPEIILISDDSDESDNERVEDDASTNSIEIKIFLNDFDQKYLIVDLKYESLS